MMLDMMEIDSLCDVGGGVGLWVSEFLKIKGDGIGLENVRCLDGDYVKENQLLIPSECFIPTDLENRISMSGRRFDLAMSLEVAEHLSPERADSFVEDLVNLSDTILFSAAVPGQGGTHHVNEQHMAYWTVKFGEHGYVPFDVIRPEIQDNMDIPFWYRQNIIVFAKKGTKNYDTFSGRANGVLVHTVNDELYGRYTSLCTELEKENASLRETIDQITEENRMYRDTNQSLRDDVDRISQELSMITSGSTYKAYAWLKKHIFSKIKK